MYIFLKLFTGRFFETFSTHKHCFYWIETLWEKEENAGSSHNDSAEIQRHGEIFHVLLPIRP